MLQVTNFKIQEDAEVVEGQGVDVEEGVNVVEESDEEGEGEDLVIEEEEVSEKDVVVVVEDLVKTVMLEWMMITMSLILTTRKNFQRWDRQLI